MAAVMRQPIPGTPRVISPSPDPSETSVRDEEQYFPPTTRSTARQSIPSRAPPIQEDDSGESAGSDSDGRARSRSRSRDAVLRRRRMSGLTSVDGRAVDSRTAASKATATTTAAMTSTKSKRRLSQDTAAKPNGLIVNGHLSPASAAKYYWRELSRSPSPLGLIPIHREWRSFIHRHEIPRKVLHVSVGFLTLALYMTGSQASAVHPWILGFLIPISLVDILRHNWPPFNRFYIRCLGAFMRETEAHEKYNGVIWYMVGIWMVLRFCPKDIGVMSVLLLSWCDTAASTFGRLFGRYTPRIRRGKSLAGSIAACTVGTLTALLFWGWIGPHYERIGVADNTGIYKFAFTGQLSMPSQVQHLLGWTSNTKASISGSTALGVMSICTGLVASISEAVDIFGWDDNVTIPVLCGLGLWGFLKIFASA